jgi:hypothetical protein
MPVMALILIVSAVSLSAANAEFSLQRGPHWSELNADISKVENENQGFRIVVPSRVDYPTPTLPVRSLLR